MSVMWTMRSPSNSRPRPSKGTRNSLTSMSRALRRRAGRERLGVRFRLKSSKSLRSQRSNQRRRGLPFDSAGVGKSEEPGGKDEDGSGITGPNDSAANVAPCHGGVKRRARSVAGGGADLTGRRAHDSLGNRR